MPRHARGRPRDLRKTRLLALAGVVVMCAIALPLAVASGSVNPGRAVNSPGPADGAGGPGDPGPGSVRSPSSRPPSADGEAPSTLSGPPPTLGRDLATATRCGPGLSSPDGIEAQTCVLTRGAHTWARTYYRNATGEALDAVLSLMGPAARTVRMTCAVSPEDEPGTCETPPEPARGGLAAYTAVAEFARRAGQGPLLLRSGSNSPAAPAS
ncbi:hypothetical protein ABZ499_08115 [Streptomyces sp. NPDC019990]|uniref:hypothetical protein n=1 Tax=Streptomyces sp. NPDC019990 TaxID=3154693 RepID=UPI0033D1F997